MSAPPARPNLLFIWTDQQRRDSMQCYGNRWVQVPNLNRLAGESFVFEHPYVTQPVCTPSRASILTGQYPQATGVDRNNVPLPRDAKTLAELVGEGYRCCNIGKWHLGDDVIAQHGFQDWISIEDHYRKYYSKPEYLAVMSSYHEFLVKNGHKPYAEKEGKLIFGRQYAAKLEENLTKAHFCGVEGARWIREHGKQPFVLNVNMLEPHSPYISPLHGLYDAAKIPVGPTFMRPPPASASAFHRLHAEHYRQASKKKGGEDDPEGSGEMAWRATATHYWGNVSLIDRSVGMLLKALEETGQADHTIVVFTSDHGEMMGEHSLMAKGCFYEQAVSVPLLMRVPWLSRQPHVVRGAVSSVDIVPTLLDLMGRPIPSAIQGRSRAGVLAARGSLEDNHAVVQWNGPDVVKNLAGPEAEIARISGQPYRSLVHRGWKLNLCAADRGELYDMNSDPCEEKNLLDDPKHRPRAREMAARLRKWQAETGDTAPLPDV
jgi:arylsulfatase A-like enzyme